MAFVKLFSTITESSLWSESKETRVLFVTMLAKADATGFVEAALPGLARVSNLSLEETRVAVAQLEGPDPHSKNPANEGRRVLHVPERGGWQILNYQAYRERRNDEERQAYMRQYMKEYRAERVNKSKQSVNKVSKCKPDVRRCKPPLAHAEAEAEADAKVEAAAVAALESERPATATSEDPFSVDSKKNDQPVVAPVATVRNFGDWRVSVGLRVWVDRTELTEWHALWEAEGWDSMTKGYKILCGKIEEPKKIHLSHFLEIRK
jgi:hypothetical protein